MNVTGLSPLKFKRAGEKRVCGFFSAALYHKKSIDSYFDDNDATLDPFSYIFQQSSSSLSCRCPLRPSSVMAGAAGGPSVWVYSRYSTAAAVDVLN
ncbi:hypothetical protein DdX_06571 [Ditylenchus destructor]|uniref:Uncharacterized protein n=1 Tax=Ditylenchus destructor TaxID=166010 RepID=A0AAD4N7V4_9BILA|nr:hypothetical protein DdX_06571 [Ditylenchus destructor]